MFNLNFKTKSKGLKVNDDGIYQMCGDPKKSQNLNNSSVNLSDKSLWNSENFNGFKFWRKKVNKDDDDNSNNRISKKSINGNVKKDDLSKKRLETNLKKNDEKMKKLEKKRLAEVVKMKRLDEIRLEKEKVKLEKVEQLRIEKEKLRIEKIKKEEDKIKKEEKLRIEKMKKEEDKIKKKEKLKIEKMKKEEDKRIVKERLRIENMKKEEDKRIENMKKEEDKRIENMKKEKEKRILKMKKEEEKTKKEEEKKIKKMKKIDLNSNTKNTIDKEINSREIKEKLEKEIYLESKKEMFYKREIKQFKRNILAKKEFPKKNIAFDLNINHQNAGNVVNKGDNENNENKEDNENSPGSGFWGRLFDSNKNNKGERNQDNLNTNINQDFETRRRNISDQIFNILKKYDGIKCNIMVSTGSILDYFDDFTFLELDSTKWKLFYFDINFDRCKMAQFSKITDNFYLSTPCENIIFEMGPLKYLKKMEEIDLCFLSSSLLPSSSSSSSSANEFNSEDNKLSCEDNKLSCEDNKFIVPSSNKYCITDNFRIVMTDRFIRECVTEDTYLVESGYENKCDYSTFKYKILTPNRIENDKSEGFFRKIIRLTKSVIKKK